MDKGLVLIRLKYSVHSEFQLTTNNYVYYMYQFRKKKYRNSQPIHTLLIHSLLNSVLKQKMARSLMAHGGAEQTVTTNN